MDFFQNKENLDNIVDLLIRMVVSLRYVPVTFACKTTSLVSHNVDHNKIN